MTPERWQRIEELYQAALDVEPSRRGAFLDAACAGDSGLRQELDSLFMSRHMDSDFLAQPAWQVAAALIGDHAGGTLSGRQLGPYAIRSLAGAGGMGEVYRARDTRLGRDVALKVLPPGLGRDPERAARFRREAQMLASLNHPNVAAIYTVDESDGVLVLVLEFVPGETLAERLAAGPLPVAESLAIARQIAEALEAAHEKGIIHRDLKPANVKLTPEGKVKVLDFGLAKALESEPGQADDSVRTSGPGTRPGMILGTPAYMSPEQARGQAVDLRADIWAFGCVLYECLTGKRAFAGDTSVDVLNAVVGREPDWQALPPETPAGIRALLARCLRKDARERLRHVVDARIWLEEFSESRPVTDLAAAGVSLPRPRGRIAWGIACAVAVVAGGLAVWMLKPARPVAGDVMRMQLPIAPAELLGRRPSLTNLAWSPDGRTIVFCGRRGGTWQLYVRGLDQAEAAPIPGTENGAGPFFSPDGQWVGFWAWGAAIAPDAATGELKKVQLDGRPPVTLCKTGLPFGASWGPDGGIVFGTALSGLQRVPASGGTPQPLTTPDTRKDEASHRLPQVLPGGKAVLFTVTTGNYRWENARTAVRSFATGEQRVLFEGAADARYVPTGHLVYVRMGTLMAVPFDLARLKVTGGAAPLVDGVMQAVNLDTWSSDSGAAQFSVSGSGALVYLTGGIQPDPKVQVVWVGRGGAVEPLSASRHPYVHPRLSPDGERVVFASLGMAKKDVWIHDLRRGGTTRATLDGQSYFPIWTPDGKRVTFTADVTPNVRNLFWKPADGSGPAEHVTTGDVRDFPGSWHRDGKTLAFVRGVPGDFHIWLASLESGSPKSQPLLDTSSRMPLAGTHPAFSPDGRWLAYTSRESGREEVYVRPYPGLGARHPVSTEGGTSPAWARNGRELFYAVADPHNTRNAMMAVDVTTAPAFRPGRPRKLFEGPYNFPDPVTGYDVAPDGRFLMVEMGKNEAPPVTHISVVLNWLEELERRVPAR